MDVSPPQKLSCKACYYSTSQLLEFLIHVRKAHYDRHASKAEIPQKKQEDLTAENCPNTKLPQFNSIAASSDTGVPISALNFVNTEADSAENAAKHKEAAVSELSSRHPNSDHIPIKFEVSPNQTFETCSNDNNKDMGTCDIESTPNATEVLEKKSNLIEESKIKVEQDVMYAKDSGENSTSVIPSTQSASESNVSSTFRGNKINNIADTLKTSFPLEVKPLIVQRTGNVPVFRENSSNLSFLPQENEHNSTCFHQRRSSVPARMHHDAMTSHSYNVCPDKIFQPFSGNRERQGFPNYPPRFETGNVSVPQSHHLSFRSSEGGFSKGASLFDSSGGFLPSFRALMCAGFVTMPRTQVLESIKCDEKKWEYIQQTLHNAFRKFPYLTAPEVQILANLTELTCLQVKTLFAVARLQHGISWDQEEIQNARNYLRIPGNRFSGEG